MTHDDKKDGCCGGKDKVPPPTDTGKTGCCPTDKDKPASHDKAGESGGCCGGHKK